MADGKRTGMIALDDYHTLVREIEEWRRKRDVARGGLVLLLKRLQTEFGVKTVQEAKALLAKLVRKRGEKLAEYAAARKAFDRKWKKRPPG